MLLKDLAYYKTGGRAHKLYQPTSTVELQRDLRDVNAQGLPYFYLGGGTNSLVTDEDWPGAVISFNQLNFINVLPNHQIKLGAGVENSEAARFAYDQGLAGIAWMNGLPGQLGGTVRMNARCYGGEISEAVREVVTVDATGQKHIFRDNKVFRGYKDTVFMDNGHAVAEVTLQLAPGNKADIKAKMDFCWADRESKGQYVHPSCGCVFKNDYTVGVPSGMLLENSGAKALRHNGAEVNPKHANFLYNVAADSRAIIETTLKMRDLVYAKFGVWLEYEMEILGKLPDDLKARVKEQRPHQLVLEELEPLRQRFRARA